jgi:uncharacterized protein (TIGR01244 family)
MNTLGRLILIVLFFVASACADDSGVAPGPTLKVDLDAVVATGEVQPIGGISTSGQPDAEALAVFADQGYVAVIDLRTAGEDRGFDEPAVVESLGMDYVSMPIGRQDITFDNGRKLGLLLDGYDGPVLVHCASGNRVGALLTLMLVDDGVDQELALETGKAAGMTSLEDAVVELLDED